MNFKTLMIILVLVLVSLGFMLTGKGDKDQIQKALDMRDQSICASNRQMIRSAVMAFAMDQMVPDPSKIDLNLLWPSDDSPPDARPYFDKKLTCPKGGTYSVNEKGEVSCSVHQPFNWDEK